MVAVIRSFRIVAAGIALLAAVGAHAAQPASYAKGNQRFVADMVREHGFDAAELTQLMGQARYRQAIIDAMTRPYEGKPWYRYRKIFLTPERVAKGAAYWRKHQALLTKASAAYGVDPEIMVAIIGIETNYGGNLGKHRVIDALSTLGFSYPKRASFFRNELEEFLLLAREEQVDTLAAVGSYAGAMGKPQFIPSSYRAYAVDFDKDGRRDLWGSDADVIGSVASYFKRHGWRRGEPVAYRARVESGSNLTIKAAEKKPVAPNTTLKRLASAGVTVDHPLPPGTRGTLIRLDSPGDEYWFGLQNFYAITRYNHSNLYAMAAYQLSREIKRAFQPDKAR